LINMASAQISKKRKASYLLPSRHSTAYCCAARIQHRNMLDALGP